MTPKKLKEIRGKVFSKRPVYTFSEFTEMVMEEIQRQTALAVIESLDTWSWKMNGLVHNTHWTGLLRQKLSELKKELI